MTSNLVESLKKLGIKAQPYKKPPSGKDVFVISIMPKPPEGIIQVNQGLAKVEIHGSKKLRQAVITVTEEPRVVTRAVKSVWNAYVLSSPPPTVNEAKRTLRVNFGISMPGVPRWSFAGVKWEKRKGLNGFVVTGKVTARSGKRTVSTFLLGVDESHNFISPLKKKASSIEEAHKQLKPKVRAGTLRQGEWFFEPLVKAEATAIDKIVVADSRKIKPAVLGASTHRALTTTRIITKGRGKGAKRKPGTTTLYARGFVVDNRKGHHKALWLPTWCKVVRNNEIPMPRRIEDRRRRQRFD